MSKTKKRWTPRPGASTSGTISIECIEMGMALGMESDYFIDHWTVDNWLNYGSIPKQFSNLPSAIEAKKIMDSPIYKLLENEDGEET